MEMWESFDEHFHTIVKELSSPTDHGCEDGVGLSYERIKDVLEYNVPHGKRTRGLTVVSSYKKIVGSPSQAELELAMTLGWAVEILQACFLVADDVMDRSDTRRGQKCWYRKPGIGLQAVNDAMILESCVFTLIRTHCHHKPFYAQMVDLFHKVIFNTEIGQSLDMLTTEQPVLDLSQFSADHYAAMIKFKTAYYSFYLPVAVAMYMAGIADETSHKKASDILLRIGSLFQVQDDFLDCYGDPEVTGKIGTDIQDTKCSWLVLEALKRVSPEQMIILQSCYGQQDEAKVAAVKKLYDALGLETVYKNYEEQSYNAISLEIKAFTNGKIPTSIFTDLLNKIYKRKK